MAYSELVKNFERIRDYMRQFYVYGFKNRSEYDAKSARSYDNERRRIESWLQDYMSFRQDESGKRVFLSVDSRTVPHNPLYQAFKAKSFTNGDITFHFYLMDLLANGKTCTTKEITELISQKYLSHFENQTLDESSVRKKLKEYAELGLLQSEKRGRELLYCRSCDECSLERWKDALQFFSEVHPLGVIGSCLLDKLPAVSSLFRFKHHYILHALDSQILCELALAIGEKRCVELAVKSQRGSELRCHTVYPVKIFISTQGGRQYLLCYHYRFHKPMFFRLDSIRAVKQGGVESNPAKYGGWCETFRENLWGTSLGAEYSLDHIEMTLRVEDGEDFIISRLEREKRCGRVEKLDSNTYRFYADVYDAGEMLPWLRTFIGRIEKLECSNPSVIKTFYEDLDAMQKLYGGDDHDLS